jgi:ribonuclease VapC
MIFVDTSAFVAILASEPDGESFALAIEKARRRITAPHVRLEACMVLPTRLRLPPSVLASAFDDFLTSAQITVAPITDDTARIAVEAFERFGKGRGHKAQLNLADCLSYAAAKQAGAALLFKGRDFAHTDIAVAPLG